MVRGTALAVLFGITILGLIGLTQPVMAQVGVLSSVEINSDLQGHSFGNGFFVSLANIGDNDGDGIDDMAVGATGAVHIMFMNTDDSVKSTIEINDSTPNGPTIGSGFGVSVENVGDLDGNGVNDLAVGQTSGGPSALHILFMDSPLSADSGDGFPLSQDCDDTDPTINPSG